MATCLAQTLPIQILQAQKSTNEPQNLPTAVTSILNHVQNRVKFYPAAIEDPSELYVRFKEYIKEVSDTPFFGQFQNKKVRKKYQSKDYNLLIDGIVGLYDGISSQDKDKLKTSIADMGKSVFGNASAEEWENLFSQSTIDMTDPLRPRFFLYYTTMHMKYTRQKAEITLQEFSVNKTEYYILPQLITAQAKTLANLDKTTVDQWMGGIDSPQRSGAKLCFDPLAISVK